MSALGHKRTFARCDRHVRFTPNSDRESGFPAKTSCPLYSKADMCTAHVHSALGQKRTYRTASTSQRYLNVSLTTFSHFGHSKVRLSCPGSSGSIRDSHILVPHFGQIGRSSTMRAGLNTSSDCDMALTLLVLGTVRPAERGTRFVISGRMRPQSPE